MTTHSTQHMVVSTEQTRIGIIAKNGQYILSCTILDARKIVPSITMIICAELSLSDGSLTDSVYRAAVQ